MRWCVWGASRHLSPSPLSVVMSHQFRLDWVSTLQVFFLTFVLHMHHVQPQHRWCHLYVQMKVQLGGCVCAFIQYEGECTMLWHVLWIVRLFQVKMEREQYQTEIRDLQDQLSEMHDELDSAKKSADDGEKDIIMAVSHSLQCWRKQNKWVLLFNWALNPSGWIAKILKIESLFSQEELLLSRESCPWVGGLVIPSLVYRPHTEVSLKRHRTWVAPSVWCVNVCVLVCTNGLMCHCDYKCNIRPFTIAFYKLKPWLLWSPSLQYYEWLQ